MVVKRGDLMQYQGWKVGENIRRLREEHNLSMADFCEKFGKSESHMRMVELGHRKISLDMLLDLAAFFDTDADHILGIYAKTDNESVDAMLRDLPAEQRAYIVEIVGHMIAGISAVA